MPLEYVVDPARHRVTIVGTGRMVVDDIVGYIEAVGREAAFQPGMSELIDLTAVEDFAVSAQDILDILTADAEHSRRRPVTKMAFVVARDYIYGMIRMYQIQSGLDTDALRIFRDRAEAEAWLDRANPNQGPQPEPPAE